MEKSKAMNAVQVKELFEREAVLIGSVDVVPIDRAVALFGKDAVKHAMMVGHDYPGRYFNGYDIGDYILCSLTFLGFQTAASFYNVQQLRKEGEF